MAAYRRKSGQMGVQGIVSLIVLCLAILVFISFYLPEEVSGAMGVFWRYISFGLCGPLYHCILILLLLTAWLGFQHRRQGLPKQLVVHCLLLYLIIGALLQFFTLDQKAFIAQVEQMTQFYQHTEPSLWFAKSSVRATTSVSLLWQASIEPVNFPLLQNVRPVGILAGTFSLALHELFGSLVGKIVLLILLAGELRIIFGFSLLEWLLAAKDVVITSNANIKQAVHETMQELAAQKAEDEAALAELYPELNAPQDKQGNLANYIFPQLTALKKVKSESESADLNATLVDNDVSSSASPSEPAALTSSSETKIVAQELGDNNSTDSKDSVMPLANEQEKIVEIKPNLAATPIASTENEQEQQTEQIELKVVDNTANYEHKDDSVQNVIEPELIDHNAWRRKTKQRIWQSVEQANLFSAQTNGNMQAKRIIASAETVLPDLSFNNETKAKPILQALDINLHNSKQAQKQKVNSKEAIELKQQVEKAEQQALNREYDLLNQSSLQPQFSFVEQEVSVDPFALNPEAKELANQLPSDSDLLADFSIWTEAKNKQAYVNSETKAISKDNIRPTILPHLDVELSSNNATSKLDLAEIKEKVGSELAKEAEFVDSSNNVKKAENSKNVELLADLDLAHDKELDIPEEKPKQKYSEQESKDSLLKASALQAIIKPQAVSKRPYVFPSLELLTELKNNTNSNNAELIRAQADKLENTLKSFGVEAEVINITTGPTITRFELTPGVGVKVAKIVNLADDIALSLAATGVRIEAPIPGKSAIGIEIPNKEKRVVDLRSLLASSKWQENKKALKVALGRDIPGLAVIADLADMTHTLIAGATGSGKSICINAILISLLYHCLPQDLKLIMVDPKVVELSVYNGIPHLLAPVVTDPKKAAKALNWACLEMEKRYQLLAKAQVRDIKSYNEFVASHAGLHKSQLDNNGQLVYEVMEHMPYLVIVIDELADLMMTAPQEVEDAINRIAAKGRACGMHLILATQRPSVDVITGVIKANVPSRIAFAVSSQVDSRTILDGSGAEKLLGKGDMLYNPRGAIKPVRGQGAYISDQDVEAVVDFIKTQNADYVDDNPVDIFLEKSGSTDTNSSNSEEQDDLFDAAIETILDAGYASVSILQRRLNIGYPRAGRLVDSLEKAGFIGPANGSKPREILISRSEWESK